MSRTHRELGFQTRKKQKWAAGLGITMRPGVLWNWTTGKYQEPRKEERIFMFLDLKDSTTLAEQMGNLIYSLLVRDFFADLSGPLLSTRGEVSHYIGDEAVIGWRPDRGIKNDACVRCFFLMEDAIQARTSFYLNRYGFVPEFKAGCTSARLSPPRWARSKARSCTTATC